MEDPETLVVAKPLRSITRYFLPSRSASPWVHDPLSCVAAVITIGKNSVTERHDVRGDHLRQTCEDWIEVSFVMNLMYMRA
ncbi:hypothetical protein BIW11_02456 [Tropilaelaps mercedesae]|uniref:Uncharacterized protein n=1 Tax=Tropilaelaps mercedesae TaxID=418985 RepID=A0A1V9Y2T6_9ACAR|nr:hypothetical protein BIW11_02456 [Tropilaelaps mercedesae]